MSQWIARARKDYLCDICGKMIRKGQKRLVESYRCPAYTMIDKNICLSCANSSNKSVTWDVSHSLKNPSIR